MFRGCSVFFRWFTLFWAKQDSDDTWWQKGVGAGGAAKMLAPPPQVLPAVDPDLNPVE